MYRDLIRALIVVTAFAGTLGGCTKNNKPSADELSGVVKIDGSSTVFPISEAVAEEFQKAHRKVRVTVGVSGTGGGFKKFTVGETDINDASRPIKQKEIDKAKANGIEYIELPVAYDGISVVVNPKNDWVKELSLAQLRELWSPESKVRTWKDLDPEWPDRRINLFGPGPDSGTFDYFTEAVTGKGRASRSDYTASEDDNVLVTGISQDIDALGYFGYAYFAENREKLRALALDAGQGAKAPSSETVKDGSYPLSRPVFIYVSSNSAKRPEVASFIEFYLANAGELVPEVGYISLEKAEYDRQTEAFKARKVGRRFAADSSKKSEAAAH